MNEFNSGMSYIRKAVHIVESLGKIYKLLKDMNNEEKHLKEFESKLRQKDPSKPVMNEQNAVFYNTEGLGHEQVQKILDGSKIPNATYIQEATGQTVIAIPKQYTNQANPLLGAYKAMQPTHVASAQEKKLLKILESDKARGTMPSPLVTRGLRSGYVSIYSMSHGASLCMSKKLSDARIPHAMVTAKDGSHYLIASKLFAHQIDTFDKELQQTPSFVSRTDFMKQNVGKQIVEHQHLTEGQALALQEKLMGSGFECNLEKQSNMANANIQAMREQCPGLSDDTYVLRYNAKYAKQVEPIVAETLVRCNGTNRDAIEAHATQINNIAHNTVLQANQNKSIFIVDALHPENHFSIDKSGLRDAKGTLITTPQNKQFDAQIHAIVKSMKSPLAKEVDSPAEKRMEDVFTREEIAKAQEGWARTQPDEAGLAASKLAALKVSTDLSAQNANIANICNDAAMTAETLSNGIEEGTFRYSAEEIYKIMDMTNIHDVEGVIKEIQEAEGLSDKDKVYLTKLVQESPDKALQHLDKLQKHLPKTTYDTLTDSIEHMDDSAARFIQATKEMSPEQKSKMVNNMTTFAQYNQLNCTTIKTIGIQDLALQDIEEHFNRNTDDITQDIGRAEIESLDVGAPVLEGDI